VDNGRIVCNRIIFSSTVIIVVVDFLMLYPVFLSIQNTGLNQVYAELEVSAREN
jgi:hypothetical protein